MSRNPLSYLDHLPRGPLAIAAVHLEEWACAREAVANALEADPNLGAAVLSLRRLARDPNPAKARKGRRALAALAGRAAPTDVDPAAELRLQGSSARPLPTILALVSLRRLAAHPDPATARRGRRALAAFEGRGEGTS